MLSCGTALSFQSTRPLRGGTYFTGFWIGHRLYFNPPAPCGAGLHDSLKEAQWLIDISIHPPLAGRDSKSSQKSVANFYTYNNFCPVRAVRLVFSRAALVIFGARSSIFPVRTDGKTDDRFPFARLNHQHAFRLITRFDAEVLYSGLVFIAQIVEA